MNCPNNLIYYTTFNYFKSIVYIRQMHILANSQKSAFPINADFFPQKF